MNTLIVIAAVMAMGYAAPVQQGVSLTQDTIGNYNLKYVTDESSRNEQGFEDGKVIGSYSYTDKDGVSHKVTYVAAPNAGFVAQGNNLPTQVQETPEVAAARSSHLAIVEKARALLPPLREEQEEVFLVAAQPNFPSFSLPTFHHGQQAPAHHAVIDNTAELEAATAEHFEAHQIALARLAEEYRKLATPF